MCNVSYQDVPVYIQHVNNDETARIYPLDDPEQELTVPLSSLREQP